VGVLSLRRRLLAQSADCVALGVTHGSVGGGAEAFGQSEALTTRLRHIVGDYAEGPGAQLFAKFLSKHAWSWALTTRLRHIVGDYTKGPGARLFAKLL